MQDIHQQKILVLDFGSQYTQLIARRLREARVYCEIHPFDRAAEAVRRFRPNGLPPPGGPALPRGCFERVEVPVLGICYGAQLMAHDLGGAVERSARREFGPARIE